MPRNPRTQILAAAIALAIGVPLPPARPALCAAVGAADTDAAVMARLRARLPHSRVQRPADLVVVLGEKIPAPGKQAPLDRLRMMAFGVESGWRVILFQIDERDGDGRWIIPNARARDDAPPSDGVLSAKDALVFRARDLGVRAARPAWPPGVTGGSEIAVQDPLNRGRGWAYLFLFDAPPPLPARDQVRAYATSAAPGDSVLTPSYKVFYPRDARGRYVPGVMTAFSIDGAARGDYGANLLDRQKLRYTGSLPFISLFTFRRTEQQIAARPLGFIDGPLRALRPVERSFHLPWRPDAPVRGMTTFLPDRVIIDDPGRIPPRLGFFARTFEARVSWDFVAPPGSRVYCAPVPLGVAANGVTGPAEAAINGVPSTWWALATPRGGALLAIHEHRRRGRLLPAERAYPTLAYRDDQTPAPPEARAGSTPAIGWHLHARPPGAYWEQPSRVHLFVLDKFRPGDEKLRLKWIRTPLRVKVGPGLAR